MLVLGVLPEAVDAIRVRGLGGAYGVLGPGIQQLVHLGGLGELTAARHSQPSHTPSQSVTTFRQCIPDTTHTTVAVRGQVRLTGSPGPAPTQLHPLRGEAGSSRSPCSPLGAQTGPAPPAPIMSWIVAQTRDMEFV